ncbi:MAG: DUF1538 domain-containing protein [Ruminococcaceae bacterium]|nr:DUF1538 domain-containing protein [Oscillospiraceae bacterium]
MAHIFTSIKESLTSVLPIAIIVLILSVTVVALDAGVLVLFLFGTVLLILGMSFFTIGSTISMEPLGDGIGKSLNKSSKIIIPLIICFVLGLLITISEPDLQVLAQQVPTIPNATLISCVGIGVGVFLSITLVRNKKEISLRGLLLIFYILIIGLSFFAPDEFVPTAFDSGGVTTGPITVPFIMALGAGLASGKKGKHTGENSFGLVALCSIGPVLSVLLLSIFYKPMPSTTVYEIADVMTTADAFRQFVLAIPGFSKEVFGAFVPIVVLFVVYQAVTRRFHIHNMLKMTVGFIYTYIGLVLFLTGANVGFMPAGRLIGATIAGGSFKVMLIPIGMVMGYFVVSAEPAVHSLKRQVSEITKGAIAQKSVAVALSIGVSVSVGISMLRVITGISIIPFLIFGYAVSLAISFFVPNIYTGIAFDSGGVASGPMTSTFMLPFAMGACEAVGGNIMTDAFGIVAMIAMTPLITIQVLGLYERRKNIRRIKRLHSEISLVKDDIIFFEEEGCAYE